MRRAAIFAVAALSVAAFNGANAGTLWVNHDHKRSLDHDSQECRDKAMGWVHHDQTEEHIFTDATIATAICMTTRGWRLTGFTSSRN